MGKTHSLLYGWAHRNEWLIVSFLIGLLFVVGYLNYYQMLASRSGGDAARHWDALYGAIKLFIFNGPDVTEGWPLSLQLVRILAPFLLVYAAVKTIWRRAGEHLSLFLLRFRPSRFVIICGVGETGFRLARQYLEETQDSVVLIDHNPMNSRVAELSTLGAIAVIGDAMDPATFIQAKVLSAREVFVFTGDDEANIAVAKIVHRLVRSRKRSDSPMIGVEQPRGESKLRCHIQVDAPEICEIFQDHSFFNLVDEQLELKIFNRDVYIARNIFDLCAPDLYYLPEDTVSPPMTILILGFGSLARSLLIQYALTAHYADFRRPRVVVMCEESSKRDVGRFYHRYANINQVVDLEFVYQDPAAIQRELWLELMAVHNFTVCYCALPHDADGILAVRRLNRMRNAVQVAPIIHFVVCLNQQSWIADVVDDDFLPIAMDKLSIDPANPVEYFETLDETISIDVVVNDSLDRIAIAIHHSYLQDQHAAGASEADNPSVVEWRRLPLYKKVANQRAASHLDVKLRIAGYSRSDEAGSPGVAAEFPPNEQVMEVLARVEHQRWTADKLLAGYSLGAIRDDGRFLHPDLKPWQDLSDTDRDKDRAIIRQIPKMVAMLGQVVIQRKQRDRPAPSLVLEEQGTQ